MSGPAGHRPPRLTRRIAQVAIGRAWRDEVLADLDQEFHEAVESGASLRQARRRFRRQTIRSIAATRSICTPPGVRMPSFSQSLRSLAARPFFSLTAIVTLGLAIGLTAAVLALVHEVFILPATSAPEPDRVLTVSASVVATGDRMFSASIQEQRDLAERSRAFAAVSPYAASRSLTWPGDDLPEPLPTTFCEAAYFTAQGARTQLGRLFEPHETAPGSDFPLLVLTHETWQRRFGGRPDVVGETARLSGRTFTIIGVLAPRFRSSSQMRQRVEAFAPLPIGRIVYGDAFERDRVTRIFNGVAVLAPGVSLDEARRDADRVAAELRREFPAEQGAYGFSLLTMREHFYGEVFDVTLALLAGVAFVLLIACVNLGHLWAVHAEGRRREWALRKALGASQGTVAAVCLADFVWMAAGSLVVAVLVGQLFVGWFNLEGALRLPSFVHVSLGWPVLALSAGVLAACTLVAASGAVVTAIRADLASSGAGRSTLGRQSARLRDAVIVAEAALAVALLVGAGLTVRTMMAIERTSFGIDTARILTGAFQLSPERYPTAADRSRAVRAIHGALQDLPGADAVVLWGPRVLGRATFVTTTTPSGYDASDPAQRFRARRLQVSPGALHALGIRILEGREFDPLAHPDSPLEVVVGSNYARRYWPGKSAVGESLRFGPNQALARVVGVAADVRHLGRAFDESAINGDVYFNQFQLPMPIASIAVRYRGDGGSILEDVRRRLARVDGALVVGEVATLEATIEGGEGPQRLSASLFAVYGAVAALLTGLGVFGVVAFGVNRRTREFGVRLALGARPSELARDIVASTAQRVGYGVALGMVGAWAGAGTIRGLLVAVEPRDHTSFAAAAALTLAMGVWGALVPALRVARISPLAALRTDD